MTNERRETKKPPKRLQKNRGRREIHFHTRPNSTYRHCPTWTILFVLRGGGHRLLQVTTPLIVNSHGVDRSNNNLRSILNSQLPDLDPTAMDRSIGITEAMTNDGYFNALHFTFSRIGRPATSYLHIESACSKSFTSGELYRDPP